MADRHTPYSFRPQKLAETVPPSQLRHQFSCMQNEVTNRSGVCPAPPTVCNGSIVVSNGPGRGAGITDKPWNQMQVKMLRTFPEGDGIDTFTAGQFLDKCTGIPQNTTPTHGLILPEINRTRTMAKTVEKQPTFQRRGIRMMTQNPVIRAKDLIPIAGGQIVMKKADRAGGIRHR